MHDNSMILMKEFVEKYDVRGVTVVDMGSFDVNGTYRDLFPGGQYIGVDIVEGRNVDIVVGSKEWDELENVDVVISGQTLEHVADIPGFMAGIYRILKPGGLFCVIAPSAGPGHDYPVWVGHFSEEKMAEVVTAGGFEILSCTVSNVEPMKDTCCVAKKPQSTSRKRKEEHEDQ